MSQQKKGDLTIRVLAMPADTNPSGDVFGGWLLSQMDIAGGVFCRKIAKGRVVTVAIDSTTFKLPVFVGDTLCCYVHLIKKGRTSITVGIEAWVNREFGEEGSSIKVTEGEYTYVKVDEKRSPVPI
ncbi:MAG: acyl-CoA thioesterase [Bacteroidetes bacterium]|nr:acyl-CoA thioesterase [Bacteroidota bacterium]MDC0339371.1 acyl-CoA thioesterase [Flavobacteriales bacterium]